MKTPYNNIFQARMTGYNPITIEDEEHTLKEMLQEVMLYALSKSDFFSQAAFHGGTSLRVLYKLPRFSEDLDFVLKSKDENFKWEHYINKILSVCEQFGIESKVTDKSKTDSNVKKMFLKDNSIGKIIDLKFHHHARKMMRIKFEIDVNPPRGATHEMRYIDFPIDSSILCHDLPSNFSGKLHALLCRTYLKGRDWYDFIWYIKQQTQPNFELLTHALFQNGPWEKQKITANKTWLLSTLESKIKTIDWKKAQEDVKPFLRPLDAESINLWSEAFFTHQLNQFSAQETDSHAGLTDT